MKKRIRPGWDEQFMFLAYVSAMRSSCEHLQTGAVVVVDKRVISSGYNGAPPGIENCLDRGCRKDQYKIKFDDKGKGVCRGTHAEINALNQIARKDLEGAVLYSVYRPCSSCAKAIVADKISEVIFSKSYEGEDNFTDELFLEGGIKLNQMEIDLNKIFKILKYVNKK